MVNKKGTRGVNSDKCFGIIYVPEKKPTRTLLQTSKISSYCKNKVISQDKVYPALFRNSEATPLPRRADVEIAIRKLKDKKPRKCAQLTSELVTLIKINQLRYWDIQMTLT